MIAQQSSALAAQMGSGAHASRVLHLAGHQMLIPARVPLSGDHSQIWHSESAYHQAHKKFGKVKQGKASILTPPGGGRPFYTPYVPAWERKFLYFQPFYPCSNCSIHVIFNPQNLRFSPAKLSTLNSPSSQPFNSIPMLDARLDPPHSGS